MKKTDNEVYSLFCDVEQKNFPFYMVRNCLRKDIISDYGNGVSARVCWYVCKSCRYAEHHAYVKSAIICRLEREKREKEKKEIENAKQSENRKKFHEDEGVAEAEENFSLF